MKRTIAAALCALLGAGHAAGAAAQDDDWEFAEDPARQLTVAASRYDAGPSIIVQCRAGALTAMLIGMPAGADRLDLNAARADGRTDVQTWYPAGADGMFKSSIPARDVRFMRGGGAFTVRTGEGEAQAFNARFDLPAQSANLDRVLTACGWDLTDDRDAMVRTTVLSLTDPDAGPGRVRRSRSRSISERGRQTPPPPPPTPTEPTAPERLFSCIVRDLRLAECRPVRGSAVGTPEAARILEWLNGRRVYGAEPSAVEGRVFYNDRPEAPLIVVREERIG